MRPELPPQPTSDWDTQADLEPAHCEWKPAQPEGSLRSKHGNVCGMTCTLYRLRKISRREGIKNSTQKNDSTTRTATETIERSTRITTKTSTKRTIKRSTSIGVSSPLRKRRIVKIRILPAGGSDWSPKSDRPLDIPKVLCHWSHDTLSCLP